MMFNNKCLFVFRFLWTLLFDEFKVIVGICLDLFVGCCLVCGFGGFCSSLRLIVVLHGLGLVFGYIFLLCLWVYCFGLLYGLLFGLLACWSYRFVFSNCSLLC